MAKHHGDIFGTDHQGTDILNSFDQDWHTPGAPPNPLLADPYSFDVWFNDPMYHSAATFMPALKGVIEFDQDVLAAVAPTGYTGAIPGGTAVVGGVSPLAVSLHAGNNLVIGGTGPLHADLSNGNDIVVASSGHSRINLGNGNDLVILADQQGHDVVDAAGATGNDLIIGYGDHDVVHASNGSNREILLGEHETVYGGSGNDIVSVGAHSYVDAGGGDGNCIAFSFATSGVTVNLETGRGSRGDAEGSTFVNFQQVKGSIYDDVLIANHAGSELKGNMGNDTLIGGVGNDTFLVGVGHDTITSGGGHDVIVYGATNTFGSKVTDFNLHNDVVFDLSAVAQGFNATFSDVDHYIKLVEDAAHDSSHLMLDVSGSGVNFLDVAELQHVHGMTADQLYAAHNILL